MAQFKAFSSNSEVIGQGILVLLEGMSTFRPMALQILKEQGISDVRADKWYSLQAYLDAYRRIAEKVGPTTLKMIGKKAPELALWPPQVNSIETALASIDVAYRMNNRGGNIGSYKFEKTGERTAKMVCHTPYPCSFDSGLVEATAKKFAPAGALVTVTHDDTQPCRQKNGETCTLSISW